MLNGVKYILEAILKKSYNGKNKFKCIKLKIAKLDPFVSFHHPIQSAYISSKTIETWSYI